MDWLLITRRMGQVGPRGRTYSARPARQNRGRVARPDAVRPFGWPAQHGLSQLYAETDPAANSQAPAIS